jgi:hypothetical protein
VPEHTDGLPPLVLAVRDGWEVVQVVTLVAGTQAWQEFNGLVALLA